jgi:hypothetical protein
MSGPGLGEGLGLGDGDGLGLGLGEGDGLGLGDGDGEGLGLGEGEGEGLGLGLGDGDGLGLGLGEGDGLGQAGGRVTVVLVGRPGGSPSPQFATAVAVMVMEVVFAGAWNVPLKEKLFPWLNAPFVVKPGADTCTFELVRESIHC